MGTCRTQTALDHGGGRKDPAGWHFGEGVQGPKRTVEGYAASCQSEAMSLECSILHSNQKFQTTGLKSKTSSKYDFVFYLFLLLQMQIEQVSTGRDTILAHIQCDSEQMLVCSVNLGLRYEAVFPTSYQTLTKYVKTKVYICLFKLSIHMFLLPFIITH